MVNVPFVSVYNFLQSLKIIIKSFSIAPWCPLIIQSSWRHVTRE